MFGLFFLSAAPTAQNSPELKIHIRNDTSVYYSVMYTFHNLFGLKRAYQKENISLLTLTQLSMILDYSSENNSVMSLKDKLPKL